MGRIGLWLVLAGVAAFPIGFALTWRTDGWSLLIGLVVFFSCVLPGVAISIFGLAGGGPGRAAGLAGLIVGVIACLGVGGAVVWFAFRFAESVS